MAGLLTEWLTGCWQMITVPWHEMVVVVVFGMAATNVIMLIFVVGHLLCVLSLLSCGQLGIFSERQFLPPVQHFHPLFCIGIVFACVCVPREHTPHAFKNHSSSIQRYGKRWRMSPQPQCWLSIHLNHNIFFLRKKVSHCQPTTAQSKHGCCCCCWVWACLSVAVVSTENNSHNFTMSSSNLPT